MIILDTSALVRWLTEPDKLSLTAAQAIENSSLRAISSISVWEVALKVSRGRLELPGTIEEFVLRLEMLRDFEIIPVDARMWMSAVQLEWDHQDPADRVIVALATSYNCALVSSDKLIVKFYEKTVW